MLRTAPRSIVALAAVALFLAACGGSGNTPMPAQMQAQRAPAQSAAVQSATAAINDSMEPDPPSTLAMLTKETTIGSTIDPITGDQNPYGLDIAPVSGGSINRGDLVVCNFNDAANIQGTGDSIIALAPVPGSSPRHVVTNAALLGCTENVQVENGDIWTEAFSKRDVSVMSDAGQVVQTFSGRPYNRPFGITLARRDNDNDADDHVLYESDVDLGEIDRVTFTSTGAHIVTIANGFAVNDGVAGTELGPGGLQYEASRDRLFIVDGANNTLVEFNHVSDIPLGGIKVAPGGTSFSGPFANHARLIFSGSPLNAPISSALLACGNIVIGNTGNPNGVNLMVEITPNGHVAATKNVDNGASGAIFGMIADNSSGDTKIYFNDDNANAVMELSK